jgi:hypothetical protein
MDHIHCDHPNNRLDTQEVHAMNKIPESLIERDAYAKGYCHGVDGYSCQSFSVTEALQEAYEYGWNRGKEIMAECREINRNDPSAEYLSKRTAECMMWSER